MFLRQIFDPVLAQYAYIIGCQRTGEALVIDPERDISQYKEIAQQNGLKIKSVTETHIHADFLSGAREFGADPTVHLYLSGEGGADWSYKWSEGRANTTYLKDGTEFKIGNIVVKAIHTPGHTPEHICFLITDIGGGANEPLALATGDFLFVGDVGRPDLLESAAGVKNNMEPSARILRGSLSQKLAAFGDYLQVLPGHGAGSACGKALGAIPMTTLGYERKFNPALRLAIADGEAFVKDVLDGQVDPPGYFANMKRLNRDGAKVTGGTPIAKHLSFAEFQEFAAEHNMRVLDTRGSKDVFEKGHFKKAIHAPLGTSFFVNAAGSFLGEEDSILIVAEDERSYQQAAVLLYRIGFDQIVGWISVAELQAKSALNESQPKIMFQNFDKQGAASEGLIVDVRNTSEYNNAHIDGAYLAPYTRLRSHLKNLPKAKKLFVHCASGRRASLATSFLRAEGFDAVHVDGMFSK
jgi:hydroxyacylglutathione hydrolase